MALETAYLHLAQLGLSADKTFLIHGAGSTISGGPVEEVLDTAPAGGALPDLVRIAGGDPKRVLTPAPSAVTSDYR
jgi:hypothetical protein